MIPIIIDTDMAPDDWTAILYLAKRNDINIKAITISGTGEAHGPKGARNCLRLLKFLDINDTPVAYGTPDPLESHHQFPKIIRLAVDQTMFIKFPKTDRTPEKLSAIELIKNVIDKSSEKITILGTGPLTNLAFFFQKCPKLKDKISKIYIMGGAIDVPGNLSSVKKSIDNPYAEWNIYCDPHAANIVFQSGIPVVLIPLDATNLVPVDKQFLLEIKENRSNPISNLIYKILKRFGSRIEKGQVALWDLIAASVVGNEDIAEIEKRKIRVIEEEGQESGRTKEDLQNGAEINICKRIDKKEFENHVFNVILS